MENEEILSWLQDNSKQPKHEIKKYLRLKMEEGGLKESWQKHYFLENLKKFSSNYPKDILEIIKELQKYINGVSMGRRYIAYIIDFLVYSILFGIIVTVIDSISPVSNGFVLAMVVIIYFLYFIFCTYKFNTTIGLFILRTKIEFERKENLLWRIFLREILSLTVLTGIGAIYYLFQGAYWDYATGAKVVWLKNEDK